MCQGHIQRFSCAHGLLMGIDVCRIGPCPILKTTGAKLPQQPFRCYNCQHRASTAEFRSVSSRTSSSSSVFSLESASSNSSYERPGSPLRLTKTISGPTAPLPNVARQPSGSVSYGTNLKRLHSTSAPARAFTFSCSSSNHYPTTHYTCLPSHLPHQNHACPPCQIQSYCVQSDMEVTRQAKAQFPHLTSDMLVRNGRIRENWESNLTLEKYVSEKRQEDKELWLHVIRKWTQDLKKIRVMVAAEDGLSLMP